MSMLRAFWLGWRRCARLFSALAGNGRACRSVELRALCNEVPRTPPGPEGSNGIGNASGAADHPKFLSLKSFPSLAPTGCDLRNVVFLFWLGIETINSESTNELPGHSPQVAPANLSRPCRTTACNRDAGERDQK